MSQIIPEGVSMAEIKKKDFNAKGSVKPNKYRGRHKTVILVIIWAAALLLIGYFSFTVSRNNALSANRIAESALSAIYQNDAKKVYELGSDDFKKVSSRDQVKKVVEEWNPVLAKATDGEPELVSKIESTKDSKRLTTLIYKYDVRPGKSKINQKEFYVRVIIAESDNGPKISVINFDVKKKDLRK